MQASVNISVSVVSPLTPNLAFSLGPWEIGQVINAPCSTAFSNGVLPYIWNAVGLPTGLAINSATGVITGTVGGSAGTLAVTIKAIDANG